MNNLKSKCRVARIIDTDISTALGTDGFTEWLEAYAKCSRVPGYPKGTISDFVQYLKDNYLKIFNENNYKVIMALNENTEIVGIAGVNFPSFTHLFTKIAVLETFFVLPEYRGVGAKLLARVKHMSKESGCNVLLLSAPIGSELEQTYSKIGIPTFSQYALVLHK